MEITAKLGYYRVSPRKVRLVAGLVRGKKVDEAIQQLSFLTKRSSPALVRLLKSAVSNAKTNFKTNSDNLYVKEIAVNEGPTLKRHMPKARGSADIIRKRTSRVTVVLVER